MHLVRTLTRTREREHWVTHVAHTDSTNEMRIVCPVRPVLRYTQTVQMAYFSIERAQVGGEVRGGRDCLVNARVAPHASSAVNVGHRQICIGCTLAFMEDQA